MDELQRLSELGMELPNVPKPIASYELYSITGNLIYIAGQGPTINGKNVYVGKVGRDVTKEEAYESAKLCGLNILAILKEALGSLDKVSKIVHINGYVNSIDEFYDQPYAINGVSDLMFSIFGEKGKHSRAAISVNSLPMNIPIEVEIVSEIVL